MILAGGVDLHSHYSHSDPGYGCGPTCAVLQGPLDQLVSSCVSAGIWDGSDGGSSGTIWKYDLPLLCFPHMLLDVAGSAKPDPVLENCIPSDLSHPVPLFVTRRSSSPQGRESWVSGVRSFNMFLVTFPGWFNLGVSIRPSSSHVFHGVFSVLHHRWPKLHDVLSAAQCSVDQLGLSFIGLVYFDHTILTAFPHLPPLFLLLLRLFLGDFLGAEGRQNGQKAGPKPYQVPWLEFSSFFSWGVDEFCSSPPGESDGWHPRAPHHLCILCNYYTLCMPMYTYMHMYNTHM